MYRSSTAGALTSRKERTKKGVKHANCKAIKIPYKTTSGTILESTPFPQPLKEVP